MKRRRIGWWAALLLCGAVVGHVTSRRTTPVRDTGATRRETIDAAARNSTNPHRARTTRARTLAASLGGLPLAFEKNEGQVDSAVKFLTRGSGYQLFFTSDGATWTLNRPAHSTASRAGETAARVDDPHRLVSSRSDRQPDVEVLRMRVLGANPDVRVAGVGEQPGKAHYFRGSDPASWHTNVLTFARVQYGQIYPGVDLVYYGRDGLLEYDFVVAPGVDPAVIALGFDGADRLSIDETGDLVLETQVGRLVQHKPLVYQHVAGVRHVIESAFVLTGRNQVGFVVGAYDQREPLLIDPVIAYSTFLGGSGGTYGEQAYGVTVDDFDNVYITGNTRSTVFPVGGGTLASNDAFVVKLTPSGALEYVALFGGNSGASGEGIAVDHDGQVLVTGFTDATNFPTLNPIRLDQPARDAFLMKLDPAGLIVYSTYLGGSGSFDYGEAVAFDDSGNGYVTGVTNSTDFPVLNALQPARLGQDAYVVKVDPAGNLLYGTFLGGSGSEAAESIAVDDAGSFYVTGWTTSTNFPRVQSTQAKQSGEDVFVSKYMPDGGAFAYSRYLGGNSNERPFAITLDGADGVYVGGRTDSTNFPALLALQGNQVGTDVFLTRLGPIGAVSFSTYLGGDGWERILGLSVRDGRLYATGQTLSTDFPSVNAVQPAKAGDPTMADAFVVSIDIASAGFVYSTYIGGAATEEGRGVAALSGGNVFVAGWTESTDFPTVRPIQDFNSNVGNVFVARVAPLRVDAVTPAFVMTTGGNSITITGQEFAAGATVLVGGVLATNVTVVDDTTITATTPSLSAGTVDVTVTNPDGGSGTLYGELAILDGTGPVAHAGPDQSVEATGPSGTLVLLDGSASFDPDNEPLTYEWRDEHNNLLGTNVLVTPALSLGPHTITLTVSDGLSTPGVDTLVVTIVDTTGPTVTVVSPNGSNRIFTGTPTYLEWTASDNGSGLSSFDVYLSTNGGSSFDSTPICAGVSGTLRSCTWTSPGPTGSKARIRVTARDMAGNTSSDSSNGNFTILSGTASVKVTTPNTNVNWGAGSTQHIKWSHNLGTAAYVRLEASFDGGATWSLINAAVKNSAASSGVYGWTLPGTLSPTARIRASWNNGPVSDVSDVNFTIAAPFIAVTGPSASTNWGYGTTRTQTWTTNLGPSDRVAVLLSTNGGATFPIELATDKAATAKTATFTTATLASATAAARLSVAWTNAPSGFAAQGISPANFRVEAPFVTVTSPDGGNTWPVGTSRTISWSHNLGTLENVLIDLSGDDGASYPIVLFASTPSDGSASVTVNTAWTTTLGRVRITWLKSGAVTDASNASFVIQ